MRMGTVGRSATQRRMAAARPHGVVKKVIVTEQQTHKLPSGIIWLITVLVALIMGTANFCSIWVVRGVVEWKFDSLQSATDWGGPLYGILILTAVDAGLAVVCTVMVFSASPAAGSSGAPENKGWLNGSVMDDVFTFRNLIVRACAMLLANCSSYPVGREGPSVTMGSNIAFLVTKYIGASHVRYWVDVAPEGEGCNPVLIVDEERLRHAQRVAGAVGGACAMAMIFDAPIGGVLYMFEEVTVVSWPLELTFRAFTGTLICSLLSYFMLDMCGTTLKAFVLYEWNPSQDLWDWQDIPVFFVIAAILGPFSALHTKLALAVGAWRQSLHARLAEYQPWARMFDAVFYSALCAVVCGLTSLLARCDSHYEDETQKSLSYVRFSCEEGSYNSVASLLLTTSEGAVRRLFSLQNTGELFTSNTLLAFVAYTSLNIGLTGVQVPSGNFTGTMLIGGLVGRFVGAVARRSWRDDLAPTGVYAMVGSAAMLCGFKKISMAVVVFIVEAGNDLNLTTPLMMSVVVSLLLNNLMSRSGFDEEQILRRNIPWLPPRPPRNISNCRAADLCDLVLPASVLAPEATLSAVESALEQEDLPQFPVVDDKVCIGFVPRSRLEAACRAVSGYGLDSLEEEEQEEPGSPETPPQLMFASPLLASTRPKRGDRGVPVSRLVTPLPFNIPEDSPAKLFYNLFSKAGCNVACVTSRNGEFVGMISRQALITATRTMEEEAEEGGKKEEDELLTLHGGLQVPLRWFEEPRETRTATRSWGARDWDDD